MDIGSDRLLRLESLPYTGSYLGRYRNGDLGHRGMLSALWKLEHRGHFLNFYGFTGHTRRKRSWR
eukprot:scaffold105967_cov37-Attheya_sp.AAC.1